MDFAEENPMTFATGWYGGSVPGNGWHTSESAKGLYDPCPVGYRVPDGGENGFWATAYVNSSVDSENRGMCWNLADCETLAWYPVVGNRYSGSGNLVEVGNYSYCWTSSISPTQTRAYTLRFSVFGKADYAYYGNGSCGDGCSVRCVRE
jgi:hypothetical protein